MYPLKPNKKLEVSTPRVQKIDSKLKDIEIPKIGKKTVEKRVEPKKVEPKGIVPSPLKPKTVVTVPQKKEEDTKKLPIDK